MHEENAVLMDCEAECIDLTISSDDQGKVQTEEGKFLHKGKFFKTKLISCFGVFFYFKSIFVHWHMKKK